jgi:TonB family protein
LSRSVILLLLSSITVSFAFAAKADKKQIETEVRAALAQSGFRHQPVTVVADLKPVGSKEITSGKYWLLWNSREDWAERIDIGPYSDLLVAKGETQFRTSNSHIENVWTVYAREAFDPQFSWRNGVDWTLISAENDKIHGLRVECATFKRHSSGALKACIDVDTKDVVYLDQPASIWYSQFELFNGRRYPRHIEAAEGSTVFLSADVTAISPFVRTPEVRAGMDQQPNCTAAELTGGDIKTQVPPKYPSVALNRGLSGTVGMLVDIDEEGNVKIKGVFQSAGQSLDDAAKEAVSQWKYSPFMCRGVNVSTNTVITVNFSMGH